MLTMLLASLNERRREMAILRSVGARPVHIFGMFVFEATVLTTIGTLFGLVILCVLLVVAQPIVDSQFGVFISISLLTLRELSIISLIIIAGTLIGTVPAYQAYRYSLTDGMMVKS
jgi:putative ABC transport system permease protein